MTKIYYNKQLIWDKNGLPNEQQARRLLKEHVEEGLMFDEAAIALSAGIDVRVDGNEFRVELSTDNLIRIKQKKEG